jgi:RimJ/RimL family protein N-acetyltransferase
MLAHYQRSFGKFLIKTHMQNITFHPLHISHFPLLVAWLNEPHVRQWWPHHEPWTLESVNEKYTSYTRGYKIVIGAQKPIHAFIITVEEQPIGYIQYYNAYDFPRDDSPLPANIFPQKLAAFDFFISDPAYLGKGLGAQSLKAFLEEYIWKSFDACFVDPEAENIAAVKTYQKAGFTVIQQQETSTWMVALKKMHS